MQNLSEEKLTTIEIDLGASRKKQLDESFLRLFGWAVQKILKRMFGGEEIPVSIRGSSSEVKSFARTLDREKRYMDAYLKYGLGNSETYDKKYALDAAVKQFEQTTGLKWPFK